ncbi:HIT-like protein [Ganoderma leucocontextum]|nr:HIT-like protein [Ganoderma leucocontextum]
MHLDTPCTSSIIDDLSCHRSQRTRSKLRSIIRRIFAPPRTRNAPKIIDDVDEQSVLYPDASPHPFCIFCGASKEKGFNIVWENDGYAVFTDINPSAEHHLQIIPKRHIESVKGLHPSDAVMVREMIELGHKVLDTLDTPSHLRRLGFHIPPYISIPHLHMHVQALPYRSLLRRLKYPVVTGRKGYEKGFSWFADAEQTARLLEKGVQVRILPC